MKYLDFNTNMISEKCQKKLNFVKFCQNYVKKYKKLEVTKIPPRLGSYLSVNVYCFALNIGLSI